jgi:prephenate dehydrogenase
MMKKWDTVAIVGVGLIGGSVGLSLRNAGLAKTVVGIGRRQSSLRKARVLRAVTTTTTKIARGVADAELTVVCSPVQRIADHVAEAADACPRGALITDAGSIKARILADLKDRCPKGLPRDVVFVGSHPLAGSDKSGVQFATDDLFRGRPCIVTPTKRVPDRFVRGVSEFWRALGARVVEMTPAQHDAVVACVSHVPHIAASALASLAAGSLDVVGTGWLDTTRIAAGDVELWRQILTGNRSAVLKALDKYETVLSAFRDALAARDEGRVRKLLEAGKDNRVASERAVRNRRG